MNNNKFIQSTLDITFDNSTDFLTIPDSLITYTRDTVFSTWQIIELQLSQVDPVKDPDVYQAKAVQLQVKLMNYVFPGIRANSMFCFALFF
jgi:hypothetical protein